jgi:hypothetical protein
MRRIFAVVLLLVGMFASSAYSWSSLTPPPNVRITNTPQLNNEEQVWLCPTDSNIVIANWRDFRLGYRQIGIGRSINGGATWIDSLIPVGMQFYGDSAWQSDPTLTVDRLGNFYMCVLDFVNSSNSASSITFYNSFDKGISWNGPYAFATGQPNVFEDKQFITVDRTGGPFDSRLYCSWTRFDNPTRIMLIRSTDAAVTFSDTVIVGPTQTSTGCGANIIDAGQFSIPVVNKNGNVHVFWQGFDLDSGGTCSGSYAIKHSRSTNGGVAFTQLDTLLRVSGYMSSNGGANTYSQPVADADLTAGPHANNLYVAFANTGQEDFDFKSDVDFMRSTDDGLTWSNRITVNDDNTPNSNAFHPWLIVNEEGVIIVVFYDERLDSPSYTDFNLWAAYSFDGGLTFTTNHRISSASSPLAANRLSPQELPYEVNPDGTISPLRVPPMSPPNPAAGLIGEYIGVTAYHDKMVAVWTDIRHGNQEAYSARWYLPLLEPRLLSPETGSTVSSRPILTWGSAWKEDDDRYLVQVSADSTFMTGVTFGTVFDNSFATSMIADGTYYWRVMSLKVSNADTSAWSPTWSFVFDAPLSALPALISPADGYISQDATPTFDWESILSAGIPHYWLELSTNSAYSGGDTRMYDAGLTPSIFTIPDPLLLGSQYYWRIRVVDDWFGTVRKTASRTVSYQTYICGDVNNSGTNPNVVDITYLVQWLFLGGPPPPIMAAANVNGTPPVNIVDLTTLVQYLFMSGPPLNCN